MFHRIIFTFLAGLFLINSMVLPLGDFSLLRDIPRMYHNYSKITASNDKGFIDFIGDYLLHGKDIFGHNKHDKTPKKGDEVQFIHQASPLNVVFLKTVDKTYISGEFLINHSLFIQWFISSNDYDALFRPPSYLNT